MNVNQNQFLEILRGRYDNLPSERSNVVRIFLSSTFTGQNSTCDVD